MIENWIGHYQIIRRILLDVKRMEGSLFNNIPQGLSKKEYKKLLEKIKINTDKILNKLEEQPNDR